MRLGKRFNSGEVEARLGAEWQDECVYQFDPRGEREVYSIDTPPPTVSGNLHLGHCYSYSQIDFMARFWRMSGREVFFPMGYDDNGLPTERLVERRLGIRARDMGRAAFVAKCLLVSEEAEREYEALWRRLGLSIDWRYTYRTIDEESRRISQHSFVELVEQGVAYRREAPTIWCPECGTAIAQAELDDLERESTFFTLAFKVAGKVLPIATTRPELLPACVAVFVHPGDERFRDLVGEQVRVPLFRQLVPLLQDPAADPAKGTGVVMCCTFGDTTDVEWWRTHALPLSAVIGRDGRLTEGAGWLAGLTVSGARREVVEALEEEGVLLESRPVSQSVRVHERCDTPVEYIVSRQWFVRVLDSLKDLLRAGADVAWHPSQMASRYRGWVENLQWDWCISRQRYFGVPFPVWYCDSCGEIMLADKADLPLDPLEGRPDRECSCGSSSFTPEEDVMDTWATSSLSPQIAGRWLSDDGLYRLVFPMSLRPQAHEIIRTWAFYTIVKSYYHFGVRPWENAAISGWGLAPEGMGKISKSRGGGPASPFEMIERYSADAVRYWAASTGLGKDSVIDEAKIQAGDRLVAKLWNVARFGQRFLEGYAVPANLPPLTTADRWILSLTQRLVGQATDFFRNYDFAAAKSETEVFFWKVLADNYLEMCKLRLYEGAGEGASFTLWHVLGTVLKLFAPFMPFVTDEIYRSLYAAEGASSIHSSDWPVVDERMIDDAAEAAGQELVSIATAVRRYKTENKLHLGEELERLVVCSQDPVLLEALKEAEADIRSVSRARQVLVLDRLPKDGLVMIGASDTVQIALG
jgi:valyl-tRNA synthetase